MMGSARGPGTKHSCDAALKPEQYEAIQELIDSRLQEQEWILVERLSSNNHIRERRLIADMEKRLMAFIEAIQNETMALQEETLKAVESVNRETLAQLREVDVGLTRRIVAMEAIKDIGGPDSKHKAQDGTPKSGPNTGMYFTELLGLIARVEERVMKVEMRVQLFQFSKSRIQKSNLEECAERPTLDVRPLRNLEVEEKEKVYDIPSSSSLVSSGKLASVQGKQIRWNKEASAISNGPIGVSGHASV